ncbi:MAG: class I SAM-dependent methyltransferase [Alphaproteobacteria bacterium]|nr:class I SAM-dependent methyltransferase [Alphaproteobacteria bacterium]
MTQSQFAHAALATPIHGEAARQDFVRDFRLHLATRIYPGNRDAYARRAEPAFRRNQGAPPRDRHDVRRAMTRDPYYQLWSCMQRASQEQMWDSVIDSVERIGARPPRPTHTASGTLTLDRDLAVPRYLSARDIHLQPGGYHAESGTEDVAAGAVYDRGLFIYSMGALGSRNEDLGLTTLDYFQKHYAHRTPERVLDLGCKIGNSTLPWARAFTKAEVHGIDVAAPCLRYGHTQAAALGVPVHFTQANAEATSFGTGSFDVIVSHFFMHETSRTAIRRIFAECHWLLKPGGIMLHLDIGPAAAAEPLQAFLEEWEVHNNNEQFMGEIRDMDLAALAREVGFAAAHLTKHSSQSSGQAADGYINFLQWPIYVAEKSP